MSYFSVLIFFIGPPLLMMLVWAWRRICRRELIALVIHVGIAVLYTTPWDNYLVANKVWWYDSKMVTGLTLGWVPIEEYIFFVVQTLLTGLWTLALLRRLKPQGPIDSRPAMRRHATVIVGMAWLGSLMLLVSDWQPGVYLGLITAWALIPIGVQFAFGADILWAFRRAILPAVAVPTLYLWLLDSTAIGSGTWTIDRAQSTGLLMGGVLPIEEAVFFLLTNVLIVFGMVLFVTVESEERAKALAETRPRQARMRMAEKEKR